jgi:hypothetical protein
VPIEIDRNGIERVKKEYIKKKNEIIRKYIFMNEFNLI